MSNSKATVLDMHHRGPFDGRGPIDDCHVVAFHPGPSTGWVPPARAPETDAQRLLRLESELVDMAVDHFVHSSGRAGELAVSIIALRATLGVEKRR